MTSEHSSDEPAPEVGVRRHGPQPARVRVLTRVGCHLCETAEATVAAVCDERGIGWETVDVDTAADSDDLLADHGEEIPVTFVDGVVHDYWRVDPARLAAALDA